jgi:hypothetical protein
MNLPANDRLPIPDPDRAAVVVVAPGDGPGYWAGAPSAALAPDGSIYLAYRLRRPVGSGRGYANVVARSDDGERFETVAVIERDGFDCDSLERPALVALPGGGWRMYVSCATPGSVHWRVDVLDADDPAHFDPGTARTVLPGDDHTGVKDPVVLRHDGRWHMWLCCHFIDNPEDADRMETRHGVSDDGITWRLGGVALAPTPGTWDQRGTRVAAVLVEDGSWLAYYDGRASAAANAEELTGIAVGSTPDRLVAQPGPVATSPDCVDGSLRYLDVVALPDGGKRLFYEATRRDGAHDLRTEYVPPSR